MPSKNPPAWSRKPGETTYVIALIDRTRLGAPILMHATNGQGEHKATRSTDMAKKFPTRKRAENYIKDWRMDGLQLPTVLDVPRPRPRKPRPQPIHRYLTLPLRDRPDPAPIDPMNQPLGEAATARLLDSVYRPKKAKAEAEAKAKAKAKAPDKPAGKPPQHTHDVFVMTPAGPREFVGTIEAPGRTARAGLKEIARRAFPRRLEGHADMEISTRPTPKTTDERAGTYARPPAPMKDVWLVTPLGQETPAYAVRGTSAGEALRNARAQAKEGRFTITPDDGRATSLELWISEPGKMEPQQPARRKGR